MLRRIAVSTALLVAALAIVEPWSSAQTVSSPVIIASGSSAMWTTIALAAYNRQNCAKAAVTVHPPCFHYTDSTKFNLNDTRPTLKGGSTNVDTGDLWIVWDSPTGTQKRNVWVYVKVDSVVGDRCFFANPACNITSPAGYSWGTAGNKIPSTLWGSDTVPPTDVQSLFTSSSGLAVNTAATDIRPEDAEFAICRANSALGKGAFNDGLDGLGYGTITPSGTCPAFGAPLTQLLGTPVKSGLSGSTATANVLAFNISGTDPFSGKAVAGSTVVDVGAAPITFIVSKTAGLASAKTATDTALQNIFSGDDCNASELGLSSAAVSVFLREPLSGTMNTTEASVFRRPIENLPTKQVIGKSQEKNVGSTNPLSSTACAAGGGTRTRGIGTSEVVSGVHGAAGTGTDGISYTFFSFGNVSSIAGSANYGYLTLDGIDPIGPYTGEVGQELPTCTAPCTEAAIWGSTGGSFPELRAGNYSAWSLLRMVTTSAHSTSLTDLVKGSNTYVVNDTPDYIPALASSGDPGLKVFHTHYQQRNGNNGGIGPAPTNGTFSSNGNPIGGDKGGDMGGCTISTKGIKSTTDIGFIQIGPGTTCSGKEVRD